jgi:hypothetical protein
VETVPGPDGTEQLLKRELGAADHALPTRSHLGDELPADLFGPGPGLRQLEYGSYCAPVGCSTMVRTRHLDELLSHDRGVRRAVRVTHRLPRPLVRLQEGARRADRLALGAI